MIVEQDLNPEGKLAALIEEERFEIERRWLERVREDIAPGADLTGLRAGLADYLTGLAALLKGTQPASGGDPRQVWAKVANEQGVTGIRIGFDIGQLVHELVVLRHVVRTIGREH